MNTDNKGVAVLVAAYNAESTIRQCLDSLLQQTIGDVEVICIDDCSTDGTHDILMDYASRDKRMTVLSTETNSGQAVARNRGLQAVTKPFVCMVDVDDWLSTDALEAAVNVFEIYPQTDCVLFRLMRYYEREGEADERIIEYPLPQVLDDGGCLSGDEAIRMSIDGWQLHGLYVTRTELHRQIPFDTTTRLYSDDNTTHLHFLHSREVRACQGQYFYRQHPSMTSRFNIHHFDLIEANYSLKQKLITENADDSLISCLEQRRWCNFVVMYRTYLKHKFDLEDNQRLEVETRLHKMLKTFCSKDLQPKIRRKPGYWLTHNSKAFDIQQRMYMLYKRLFDGSYISRQLA